MPVSETDRYRRVTSAARFKGATPLLNSSPQLGNPLRANHTELAVKKPGP
jgi:hypothetical protein